MSENQPESIRLSHSEIDQLLELGHREIRLYLLLKKMDSQGQGYSVEQVAKTLHVSPTTIYRSFWKLKSEKLLMTRQTRHVVHNVDFLT